MRARYTAGAVAATLAFALGCSGSAAEPKPAPQQAIAVRVQPAATAEQTSRAEAFGKVEARESAWIRAEVGGLVDEVGFADGAEVRADQVLVKLRGADARAAVADADARVRLAEATLERTRGLFDRSNASQSDVDRAVADRDLARAALDRARETLRRTSIRAPFDGVAGRRMVAVGETIDTQRVITRVESIDVVTVDAAFPERFLPALAVGATAEASVDARPDQVFYGTVTFVAPRVADGSRTVEVRAEFQNPGRQLVPGMSARLAVGLPSLESAISVPTQAVVTTADGASVWTVVEGKAERRRIVLGPRGASSVAVVEGLTAGEPVIVEGLLRLKPGVAVQVVESAP